MTPIPLVVVEEHHECFYAWNYAVRRGWLRPDGNTLLHVDEHSDLSLPRLRRALASIGDDADLARFTYDELDIGNFIWPAIYQGIFNRVVWLRQKHKSSESWKRMGLCAKNTEQTEFITGSTLAGTKYENAADLRWMEYSPVTTDSSLRTDQPVVLDIDLDYFCSNQHPDYGGQEIEITRAAFERFENDRYHFLRIAPGSDVRAEARDGQYFLLFNQFSGKPAITVEEPVEANIEARITAFARYLERHSVQPALICVCRSLHSGYTPKEHCTFVEERLMHALLPHYTTENVFINHILPADGWKGIPA